MHLPFIPKANFASSSSRRDILKKACAGMVSLTSVPLSANPRAILSSPGDSVMPDHKEDNSVNFTDYQGAKIAWRKDGDGPPLVLVHGTGGDGQSNWADLTDLLSTDFTVIRPDYSGSGDTVDDGRTLTVEYLAGQVLAALDAAGIGSFHLMGFSLGAAIAAHIAAIRPERVNSLILLAGYASVDARLKLEFELWRDLIATDRRAMAKLVLLTGFSPDALSAMGFDGVAQSVEDMVSGADWDGMARQVDLDLRIDVREALPLVKAPSLVIGCIHDHMVAPAHARALAARIEHAQYSQLPTGHLAPMERPDLVAQQVRAFLAGFAAQDMTVYQ